MITRTDPVIYQVNLMPNVKKGTYVLNIKAGTQVLRTIIVKKGGA